MDTPCSCNWGGPGPCPCPRNKPLYDPMPRVDLKIPPLGWVCPRCMRVHAPSITSCDCAVAGTSGRRAEVLLSGAIYTMLAMDARSADIDRFLDAALAYIRAAQREGGS